MYELDECLRLSQQIKKKNELIYNLECCAMSPKNQIITDMPKGSGEHSSPSEEYLIKKERLEKSRNRLQRKLDEKWGKVISILQANGIDHVEKIYLLKLRFYQGNSWKRSTAIIAKEYPESRWNINKCFRVYRYILCKINKK